MSKSNHFVILVILLLAACSSDPYQGLYEGVKGVNDAKRTPSERAISPIPSYDTYKKEREQKQ